MAKGCRSFYFDAEIAERGVLSVFLHAPIISVLTPRVLRAGRTREAILLGGNEFARVRDKGKNIFAKECRLFQHLPVYSLNVVIITALCSRGSDVTYWFRGFRVVSTSGWLVPIRSEGYGGAVVFPSSPDSVSIEGTNLRVHSIMSRAGISGPASAQVRQARTALCPLRTNTSRQQVSFREKQQPKTPRNGNGSSVKV